MPRHPRADSPAVALQVRLSWKERDRLEAAARVNRQNISDFVRDAVADRADETLDDDDRITKR